MTGHTGFKGTWLALWLKKMGAITTGFALPPKTHPSLYELTRLDQEINSIFGDITHYETLFSAVKKANPDVLFHLAAQPLVRYSYEYPVETYRTNVLGTVHVLECVRVLGTVPSVVVVTSDKCYENRNLDRGYIETDEMGGHDPYSNSKGCAELVTRSYRDSFFAEKGFVSVATGRAGNVIGGGDWSEARLIPDILRAFLKGEPALIRQPRAVRPWQHVIEPLNGYLILAQKNYEKNPSFSEGFNFGPKTEHAQEVQWVANYLQKTWGPEAKLLLDQNAPAYHEAHLLRLDCEKAHRLLGWTPKWTLETSLQKTLEWYREVDRDPSCARALVDEHISTYTQEK